VSRVYAIVAEYESPDALLKACRQVRDAGYRQWDSLTPYPIHGIDDAMGVRPTGLPLLVFGAGFTGLFVALLLQVATNSWAYPFVVSAKPWEVGNNPWPPFIPVAFEVVILLAAFAAFFGMLALNKLPFLSHPIFNLRRSRRATDDAFLVMIERRDKQFDHRKTTQFLQSTGALKVEDCIDANPAPAIPRAVILGFVLLVVASWVPLSLVARARATDSEVPRVHLIPDPMDHQAKYKPQQVSVFFEDNGRTMRLPVDGTVARGDPILDPAFATGRNADGELLPGLPPAVADDDLPELMTRGRERYGIYCALCHGDDGSGNGQIAQWVTDNPTKQSGWVQPAELYREDLLPVNLVPGDAEPAETRRDGHLFDVITNGVPAGDDYTMYPYGPQLSIRDRWAIVLYIRALQRSNHTPVELLPEDVRQTLPPAARPEAEETEAE
jgi:mono/diheme cytochrome c family protein